MKRLIFLLLPLMILAGCQDSAPKKAATIRDHTLEKAEVLTAVITNTGAHVERADRAVVSASTQPGNPAPTNASLSAAHNELLQAKDSLAPALPAITDITVDATAAATLTGHVDDQLQKERASFFSHKQKVLISVFISFAVAAAIVACIGSAIGFGPIIELLSDGFKAFCSAVLRVVRRVVTWIFHIATLGMAYLGSEFGKAIKAKVIASVNTAAPVTPAAPPAAK